MRQALVDYLVNAAWQLPLLALGAAVLSRAAVLTPRQRCWLWSGFLVLALILPLQLNLFAPKLGAEIAGASLPVGASAQPRGLDAAPAIASAAPVLSLGPRAADLLAILFGVSLALGCGRLLLGLMAARRLVRRSQPVELPHSVLAALDAFARRHGAPTPPVRASSGISGPVTVGMVSPVILVPHDLARQSPAEIKAALLHEAAHIRRGDYGFNLACELATLPLAWHPAIYPLKAGVRQARETACDQLAAQAMRSPELYAECLVALARKALPSLGRATPALAMFGQGPLERRVQAVLGPRAGGRLTPLRNSLAGVLVLAAVVVPALTLHVTPSLAAEPSVTRLPAPQALPPAAPAAPAAPQATVIAPTLDNGQPNDVQIIVNKHGKGYRHSWTTAAGTHVTVVSDSAADLTPAERAAMEAELAQAHAQVEAARGQVEAARAQVEAARGQIEAAARAGQEGAYAVTVSQKQVLLAQKQVAGAQRELSKVDAAKISRALARAQMVLNDPKLQQQLAAAGKVMTDGRVQRALDGAAKALNDPGHQPGVYILKDVDIQRDGDAQAPVADTPKN